MVRPDWRQRSRAADEDRGTEAAECGGVFEAEALFSIINNKGVFADTICQAMINVEKGVWDVSQLNM